MHEPEARLALANLDALAAARVLIVGLSQPSVPEALAARGCAVTSFQADVRAARAVPGSVFGHWLEADEPFDTVLVAMPKESERLRMWLAMARALVAPGGRVALAGHNAAGARSSVRDMREAFGGAEPVDARYHCRLFASVVDASAPARIEDWRASFGADGLEAFSYPGVFAHGRLDGGTRLLLSHLRLEPGARALDVGSGSGVIAAWCARAGARVDAVDADALAVRATTETLAANHVAGRAWASDAYSDVEDRYDVIVTNPPFHSGVRRVTEVPHRIMREARAHLTKHGELWVVANRGLAYLPVLRDAFDRVDVVAEDGGFRVYRTRNSRERELA